MMQENDTEELQERILLAGEYCEGYELGVYAGRDPEGSETDAEGQTPSYRAGFSEGFTIGRSKYRKPSTEKGHDSYAVSRLERTYQTQAQTFTTEQSEEWKSLQASIKVRGEKSWQSILLELHFHLTEYEGLAILAAEERASVNVVRTGLVRRLAKSKIALSNVG
jgi:hypothetical protein